MPEPDLPWPVFRALVARAHRFAARERLDAMDGALWGIRRAFAGEDAVEAIAALEDERRAVRRAAFPDAAPEPEIPVVQRRPADAETA